jgi:hypothetical protein
LDFWNFFGRREIWRAFQQAVTRKILTLFAKLWHFLFSLSNVGMLLATAIATESTQNCQILSKSTQRQLAWGTLKYHQNWDFYFFQKKNPLGRGCTKACTHYLDFQYNSFLYAFLIVRRRPLYVNFSILPCGK